MINRADKMFIDYCDGLVHKIYKILPLFEEGNHGLISNLQSLTLFEVKGLKLVIEDMDCSHEYIELLATLEQLLLDIDFGQIEQPIVKREIFKCIGLVKKIQSSSRELVE
jgi:hypothetical protein